MFYTMEEAAIIGGFLELYLERIAWTRQCGSSIEDFGKG